MDFLEEIKKNIQPDLKILDLVDKTINKINKQLKDDGLKATCVPGGSVAKGTFLRGDFDVDLFVRFDYKYRNEDLSKLLQKSLSKIYKPKKIHGSRDYFHVMLDVNFEIVPVLDVKDPKLAMNVTDMSPMHVDWVRLHLKKGQADEIRLLKLFCKAQGVYGAESYISGFSGHVIDILVINYGSFTDVLKAASLWKPKVLIDVENAYDHKMNRAKTMGPMIVVDPVLPERNAAAALGYEKFNLFVEMAKKYLDSPKKAFFIKKTVTKASLRKKGNVLIIEYKAISDKQDVAGAKILQCYKFILSSLADFDIVDSGWDFKKMWFQYQDKKLSEFIEIKGPPIKLSKHAESFKSKHSRTFEKNGFLHARFERKYFSPEECISDLVNSDYIRERIRHIRIQK